MKKIFVWLILTALLANIFASCNLLTDFTDTVEDSTSNTTTEEPKDIPFGDIYQPADSESSNIGSNISTDASTERPDDSFEAEEIKDVGTEQPKVETTKETDTTAETSTSDSGTTVGATETTSPSTETVPETLGSIGLKYTLINDGTAYAVTGIGVCADAHVVIPSTYVGLPVIEIGECAFDSRNSYVSFVESFTIPDSIKVIKSNAFRGCKIEALTIPDSVTYIGYGIVSECYLLKYLSVPFVGEALNCETNANSLGYFFIDYKRENNLTYYNTAVMQSLKEVIIRSGNIPANAFKGCSSIESITLPNDCVIIGDHAFYECGGLKSITIPAGVSIIGNSAFEYCRNLKTVNFENTENWWYCVSLDEAAGPDIPKSMLTDSSSAAKALTETYGRVCWRQK